jgi:hypothetical protein
MPFYEDSRETFSFSPFQKALMGEVKGVSKEVISSLRFRAWNPPELITIRWHPELVLKRRSSDCYKRAFMSVLWRLWHLLTSFAIRILGERVRIHARDSFCINCAGFDDEMPAREHYTFWISLLAFARRNVLWIPLCCFPSLFFSYSRSEGRGEGDLKDFNVATLQLLDWLCSCVCRRRSGICAWDVLVIVEESKLRVNIIKRKLWGALSPAPGGELFTVL